MSAVNWDSLFDKIKGVGRESVKLLSRVCDSFRPHGLQHTRLPLSITNSGSFLRLMSIESVMPSNHLILFHPLLLPSIFPSIRVFSNESVLRIRWPKYWSFSFSISPSDGRHPHINFPPSSLSSSFSLSFLFPPLHLLITCAKLCPRLWEYTRNVINCLWGHHAEILPRFCKYLEFGG